jgi:CPA2 family monovalent cation:H+ antiporter-2
MEQHGLISTMVAAIVLAFVFGFIAQRLRLSPIVGYLVAGVAVGPFTPGYVADTGFALQLSEIGVILLMFGVLTRLRCGAGSRRMPEQPRNC